MRKALAVFGLILLLACGGAVGGYVIGKGSGEDLEAARAEGVAAGRELGTESGDAQGYAIGFQQGRRTAYGPTYRSSYRAAYRSAFAGFGLEVPAAADIELTTEP